MKVFLSSTCYDLEDVRAVLEEYLRGRGYTPLLSDRPTFPIDPGAHRHDVCLAHARTADLFLLVIDKRYGAPYARDHSISITHAEFRAAVGNVPMIAFVRRRIWDQRDSHRKNPGSKPTTVDDPRTFVLLDELQTHSAGIWLVTQFNSVTDIVATLGALQEPDRTPWCNGLTPEVFLDRFYQNNDTSELMPLRVSVPGSPVITTSLYTRPDWTRLAIPIDSVICEVNDTKPPPPQDPETIYAKLVECRLRFRNVSLWDDPCYRLLSYEVAPARAKFQFSETPNTRYLQYRSRRASWQMNSPMLQSSTRWTRSWRIG